MGDKRLGRGDVQTDPDGSEWYITGVTYLNGQRKYARVRVGSLAHQYAVEDKLPVTLIDENGEKKEESITNQRSE